VNETPSQTIGPFFHFGLGWMAPAGSAGQVPPGGGGGIEITGTVYDGAEVPVPDAMVEFWHAAHFERCMTGPDGSYRVVTAKPSAADREAPHIDVSIFARGLLQRLVTRVYFPGEAAANASDPVLGLVPEARRQTLVATEGAGCLLFDVHLQGPRETVFFAY
jgi:protocatechuate 3,4-dioxygenase alpha subunit